jgi:hypothetical protein
VPAADGGSVAVTFDLSNSGKRAGAEVGVDTAFLIDGMQGPP